MTNSPELAKELRYGVDQCPPMRSALLYVLQVLLKLADTLIIPLLIGQLVGLNGKEIATLMSGTLLVAAVATILLSNKRIGSGYFASATSSVSFHVADFQALVLGGIPLLSGMVLFGSAVRLLLTFILRPIRHVFTPVFAGFVIISLSIYLGQLGFRLLLLRDQLGHVLLHGAILSTPLEQVDLVSLGIGALTLLVMVCMAMWSPRTLRPLGVLIGILLATILSYILHRPSPLLGEWPEIPWWGLPHFGQWGWAFNWSVVPSYCIASLITVIHFYGKIASLEFNNGYGARAYDFRAMRRGNLVVGCVGLLAGLVGAPLHDLRTETVGLQHATGVYSRWLAYPLSLCLFVLAFSPRIASILALIPPAATGAVMLFIAVHLAIVGLRMVDFPGLGPAQSSAMAIALSIQAVAPALPPIYGLFERWGIRAGDPSLLWSLLIFFITLPLFHFGYLLQRRRA